MVPSSDVGGSTNQRSDLGAVPRAGRRRAGIHLF
jgi:hypothetical protein